jgi:hypothetical protein
VPELVRVLRVSLGANVCDRLPGVIPDGARFSVEIIELKKLLVLYGLDAIKSSGAFTQGQ